MRDATMLSQSGRVSKHLAIDTCGLPVEGVRVEVRMAATRAEALRCRRRVTEVLDALGISRHPEKAVWEPTQRLEHLGLDVDAREGLFRVPPHKLLALMKQARALLGQAARSSRWLLARALASFVGYAQSVELACPMARFYLRAL